MLVTKISHRPVLSYRRIQHSDLEVLEQLHGEVFPIRYESEFFQNVINGIDIISWAAVDRSRPDGQSNEPIGFITARIVMAKDSEIVDLIGYDLLNSDQTLVYILTLGVVSSYRNLGIASSLIQEVTKYASSIQTCRVVYLHVISYNNPAIYLYKKRLFQCVRKLNGFYLINGQYYDAYLFVYYVNGSRSPCSPLQLVMVAMSYIRGGIKLIVATIRKGEEKVLRRTKCRENHCLTSIQKKRSVEISCSEYV